MCLLSFHCTWDTPTNILTNGVDKSFFPFTFFCVWLISTENKVEEPFQFFWKFFSRHLLNIIYGRGPRHFFQKFECLRATSLMKVTTSFNLSSEAARYDAVMAFEIGTTELKTSQNEMQPFHDTFENKISYEIRPSFSIFFIKFSERKCGLG